MVSQKVVITYPHGIHLRAASKLAMSVADCKSEVVLRYEKNEMHCTSNLRSMLSVLSAGIREYQEIQIECYGPDEEETMKKLLLELQKGIGRCV